MAAAIDAMEDAGLQLPVLAKPQHAGRPGSHELALVRDLPGLQSLVRQPLLPFHVACSIPACAGHAQYGYYCDCRRPGLTELVLRQSLVRGHTAYGALLQQSAPTWVTSEHTKFVHQVDCMRDAGGHIEQPLQASMHPERACRCLRLRTAA